MLRRSAHLGRLQVVLGKHHARGFRGTSGTSTAKALKLPRGLTKLKKCQGS